MCTSIHLLSPPCECLVILYESNGPEVCYTSSCGPLSPRLQTARNARPRKPPAKRKPMTNHKNSDLASQLGDLALDTRVQLRDLTSRPELNGR